MFDCFPHRPLSNILGSQSNIGDLSASQCTRTKAKALLTTILFVAVLSPTSPTFAAEDQEIAFLLSYIADSGCIFIRNGDEHRAKEASEHLQMKYDHARKRIKSAGDFIDKIAAKSSFTGRPYEVLCDGVKLPTKYWLEEALAVHRNNRGG